MLDPIGDLIRKYGRAIVPVFPTDDSPPGTEWFAYTIGNTEAGYPELLVLGDNFGMLNRLSEMMIERGNAFSDGEEVNIEDGLTVRLYVADNSVKDEFTCQANRYSDYRVMQVVMRDDQGHYSGELRRPQ